MSGAPPIIRPSLSGLEIRQLTIARAEARIMTVVREELDKLRALNALPSDIEVTYIRQTSPNLAGTQVAYSGELMDVRLRYG